jgi:hypothetical protein
VKLPGRFELDTPVGKCNPDWAILKHDDKTLYLVRESIAMPALGCGLGGLDWERIRPAIERALVGAPDVDARVYEPGSR